MGSGSVGKDRILVENASLVDSLRGRILPGRSILVEAGIIKEISTGRIRGVSDAKTVDAEGRYVMPGLFDMHVHSGSWSLPLFLPNGVTFIRDVAAESKWILSARKEVEEGKLLGPRILAHGELIDGPESMWKGGSHCITIQTEEEGVRVVNDLADKGVDAIKLLWKLSPRVFKACVNEAKKRNLPVTAHVGGFRSEATEPILVTEAIRSGVNSIEHVPTLILDLIPRDEFQGITDDVGPDKPFLPGFIAWSRVDVNSEKARKLAQLVAESRVYLVPTLVVFEKMVRGNIPSETTEDPNLRYVPESTRQWWGSRSYARNLGEDDYRQAALGFENIKRFVGLLFKAHANLGVGTDTPNPWVIPGFSMVREMELLVECGIPPAEVIRLATDSSAQFLKKPGLGTIEEGKWADLAILSANPLEKISSCGEVEHVISLNRSLDRSDLEKQLKTYPQ